MVVVNSLGFKIPCDDEECVAKRTTQFSRDRRTKNQKDLSQNNVTVLGNSNLDSHKLKLSVKIIIFYG